MDAKFIKFSVGSGGSSSPLLTGLVAYYKLNDSSGDAVDSVNSYNGSNTSVTYGTTGKISTCYTFNGSSSKTVVTDVSALDLTTTGAISCWVYPGSRSYNYIVSKCNDSTDRSGYYLMLSSSYAYIVLASDSAMMYHNSDGLVNAFAWSHIVVTWDSSNVYIYINNVASASKAVTVTPVASTNNLQIGSPVVDSSGYFDGYIDEVGIWNRLLTSGEVSTLYNSGNGKTHPFS